MTRKDLLGLAQALRAAHPARMPDGISSPHGAAISTHTRAAEAVAGYLQAQYPSFDRERFLRNAGVDL